MYRVGTSGLELDATRTFGVNLRAKDPADVFTFDGDSMQFLVFKASRSGARVENIQVDAGSGVYSSPNQPPAVSITVAPTSGLTGQELEFRGLASDADGPKTPRPYWDFGDATPYVFGTDVQHVYAKPGTYTVRFYASDSVRRSVAETTVLVE